MYEYLNIGPAQKVEGYSTRVAQLEGEHFTNTVLLFEAEVTGSLESAEAKELAGRNEVLEKRINALRAKVTELSATLDNSEEEDDTK